MARETKTIQCYPDDDIINERVKRYEAFGWELISNQHCQEYDGQTSSRDYIDGSTTITKHYSSFNKLTFSREKTSPWYGEVTKLEKQYEDIMDRRPRDYSIEPSKGWVIYGGLGVVIGICLLLLFLSWRFSPAVYVSIGGAVMAIGALLLVVYFVKRKNYNISHGGYLIQLRQWEKTSAEEAEKILVRSERIINGN